MKLGFVDGILFAEKKMPVVPKEEEPDEDRKRRYTDCNDLFQIEESICILITKYLHQQNPLQAHRLTSLKKDWHF